MLKRLGHVDVGQDWPPTRFGRDRARRSATGEPWRRALGTRLLQRSKRLIAAMDEAGHMYSPERLHSVRIAVKKLRYGLELAADSGVKVATPQVRTMKRVQDVLGKLHDLQVLQTHIAAAQIAGDSARPEPRAALEVARRPGRSAMSASTREVPAVVGRPSRRPRCRPQGASFLTLCSCRDRTRSVKMGLARSPQRRDLCRAARVAVERARFAAAAARGPVTYGDSRALSDSSRRSRRIAARNTLTIRSGR